MEQETPDDARDIANEAFWRNLQNMFAQAKESLRQMAEEHDVDLNAVSDEEFTSRRRRQSRLVKEENLTYLAESYIRKSKTVLENKDEWLIFSPAADDEETKSEILSIIYWYQYFIAAKIHRGLIGILEFDGNPDEEELNDPQSDANGSIKIALVGITRSLMAWTSLITNENAAQIRPLLDLLETIKQNAEEKFPRAKDFIRPGFDEIETVM